MTFGTVGEKCSGLQSVHVVWPVLFFGMSTPSLVAVPLHELSGGGVPCFYSCKQV